MKLIPPLPPVPEIEKESLVKARESVMVIPEHSQGRVSPDLDAARKIDEMIHEQKLKPQT